MSTTAFPAITPSSTSMGIIYNAKAFASPLNGFVQTASRSGARWQISMAFNNLTGSNRAVLQGFLAFMNGQVNRIEVGDHVYSQRGTGGNAPTVNGSSQAGTTINLVSTSFNVTNYFKAGDQISFYNGTNKELKMVTSDCSTDGSGLIAVPISPEIHTSPASGAAVEIDAPVGTFMLAEPNISWSNEPGGFSSQTIQLIEDIS